MSNLFNALPNRSTLRPRAYKALLDLVTENGELEVLQLKSPDVEKWLDEWDISGDEKSEFIKCISDAFAKVDQQCVQLPTPLANLLISSLRETSYTYLVSYARSLPPTSPKAEAAALRVIATSLRLPTIFNFDSLLKLDCVMAVKGHQLFALLKILLQAGIPEYRTWLETNEGVLAEYGIPSFHCLCCMSRLMSRF